MNILSDTRSLRLILVPALCLCVMCVDLFAVEPPATAKPAESQPADAPAKPDESKPGKEETTEDLVNKLKMPGVEIQPKGGFVDIDGEICLDQGALELIACTKDTREHEAIVKVLAKPVHIHMALLLLGAQPGNPVVNRLIGEGDQQKWAFRPASGQSIHVELVTTDEEGKQQVRPIADYIRRIGSQGGDAAIEGGQQDGDSEQAARQANENRFPGNQFIFTGSVLVENGDGPRRYIAEESGNVITISAFGCEVIGLSHHYSAENGALEWEIDPKVIPALGSKVKLRLTPVKKP